MEPEGAPHTVPLESEPVTMLTDTARAAELPRATTIPVELSFPVTIKRSGRVIKPAVRFQDYV